MGGSIKALTPNMVRLASQGTLFTNAHGQAPIRGPSRASILTGLQPYTSGNYQQVKDVDINKGNATVARSTFMPDNFEQYGYRTMGVGKIYHHADHGYHLGEKNRFAKQALWERDTRTILIFQEPEQKEGRRVATPVQLVDIYPTLTDLAGLPDYELAEGHSLSPLLDDPETD